MATGFVWNVSRKGQVIELQTRPESAGLVDNLEPLPNARKHKSGRVVVAVEPVAGSVLGML